jgi:RND family efflux transporter MFP subunit
MEDTRQAAATESPAGKEHPGSANKKRLIFSLLGIAALVGLLLFLQGVFGRGKVPPGTIALPGPASAETGRAVAAVKREVEETLDWPGTVRSRREAQMAPKLLARIIDLRVEVGSEVKSGDAIAVLDDRDIRTKIAQAKAAVAAAEAQAVQSDAECRRVEGLFEKQAATQRDVEGVQARSKAARAQVDEARNALAEAEVLQTESVLRAPFDGVVTERWAQAGDTGVPGKPVVTLQDPRQLRLEAQIPETYARSVALGMEVPVRIDSLEKDVVARIEEISPVADPSTRTLLIKAALASTEGLRPGMFGRFRLACGRKTVLLIPSVAVTRSGQIQMVRVLEGGEARLRHVRTGKAYDGLIEILSGLREGDQVLVGEQ